jgi:hypothetical protein
LAPRDPLRAVSALTLTSFRHVDRTVDADEADLLLGQCLHRITQPATLEEDVIDDQLITRGRQGANGALEPRKKRLAEWSEGHLLSCARMCAPDSNPDSNRGQWRTTITTMNV